MFESERHLMVAVRNYLRTQVPWSDEQCNVEFDEMTPATVGHLYVAVMPGGIQQGRAHNTCGRINDLVMGVDVTVIKRISNVPRDRRRDVFLTNLDSLEAELKLVYNKIDWNYAVNTAANALITADTGSTAGFVEPLRFVGCDRRPRMAPAELFAVERGHEPLGLMRTISFGGARRLTNK